MIEQGALPPKAAVPANAGASSTSLSRSSAIFTRSRALSRKTRPKSVGTAPALVRRNSASPTISLAPTLRLVTSTLKLLRWVPALALSA